MFFHLVECDWKCVLNVIFFLHLQKNPLDKWMLDTTEGPHRMRKKTMRNDQFYTQYIYRPELEDPENVSVEFFRKFFSSKMKTFQ